MRICRQQSGRQRECLRERTLLRSSSTSFLSASSKNRGPSGPAAGKADRYSRRQIVANLRNKNSFRAALAASTAISLYRTLRRVLDVHYAGVLTGGLSPTFIAGTIAGLALALHPNDARRVTIAIYFLTRTLEFSYNLLDDKGFLPKEKPWWFGSWLLFPLGSAQLLHALVYDRDCFPKVSPNPPSLPPATDRGLI